MERKTLVMGLIFLLIISFVLAQGTPAPEDKVYPVKRIKCIDSDGGLNYYSRGIISYEVIEWDAPSTQIPPEDGERDSCVEAPKGHLYYLNVASVFIRERYCETPDEMNTKYKTEYIDYDCSSEGKVCYEGACVEETEDIKKYYREIGQEREQVMGFWSRTFYWFMNP